MLGTEFYAPRAGRAKRRATLEAENAKLRRLLAEQPARGDQIYVNAGQPLLDEDGGDRFLNGGDGMAARPEPRAGTEDMDVPVPATDALDSSILAASTDCVTILDLEGRVVAASDAGIALVGAAQHVLLAGRAWIEVWQTPESRMAVLGAIEQARAGQAGRVHAVSGGTVPGETVWWDVAVAPMLGADGRPERILTVARDITELKQNEARQNVLMHEMAHRMKNTLAMVQAVATQTLRNAISLDTAGEALGARLLALSHAHDVLMQGSWSSADLRGLVDTAVALHGDGEPGRFVIDGPDVTLGPRPGLTLALILHELGTNAAKYGALSNSEGHVAITWHVGHVDGEDRLDFRWEEIGGPAVKPPTRVGFGSRLIERSLVHSFGGRARLDFPQTGVVLTVEAPAAKVMVTPAVHPAGII